MRNGRAGASEVTVRLEDPNELFEPRAADVERGRPPEIPGVERIREALSLRPRNATITVTVVLPEGKATAEVERGLRESLSRYCEAGIERVQYELALIRRDGLQTLLSGAIVLAIGLVLSEAALRTHSIPEEVRVFLGNGLFLVVAWVGLWYPLDTLFYSGRPLRKERRLLEMLSGTELTVRPEGGEDELAAADQSLTAG